MATKVLPLKDQVVLVTGSNQGLGRAIALAFARQGVLGLVINCSNQSSEALDDLLVQVNPCLTRVVVVKADVTKPCDVDRLFDTSKRNFGYPITTVVNNIVTPSSLDVATDRSKLDTISWDEFDLQLKGGLQVALNTTKAALSGMREIGFGRIINVHSNLMQQPGIQCHNFMASKGTLLAFTRSAAAELAPSNITINLISGGLMKQNGPSVTDPLGAPGSLAAAVPLRKPTTPEEMADAALFFASPWARGVTGQSICVDRGHVAA